MEKKDYTELEKICQQLKGIPKACYWGEKWHILGGRKKEIVEYVREKGIAGIEEFIKEMSCNWRITIERIEKDITLLCAILGDDGVEVRYNYPRIEEKLMELDCEVDGWTLTLWWDLERCPILPAIGEDFWVDMFWDLEWEEIPEDDIIDYEQEICRVVGKSWNRSGGKVGIHYYMEKGRTEKQR